jgi:hypothetical protein
LIGSTYFDVTTFAVVADPLTCGLGIDLGKIALGVFASEGDGQLARSGGVEIDIASLAGAFYCRFCGELGVAREF